MKNVFGRFFAPPDIEKLKQGGDVQGLVRALSYKDSPDIRREAALALKEVRDSNAVSQAIVSLVSDLASQSESVRWKASKALDEIENAGVADPLIPLLTEKGQKGFVSQNEIRTKVAEMLGGMKDSRALDGLLGALTVWNGKLRSAMAEELWTPLLSKMVAELVQSKFTKNFFHSEEYEEPLIERLDSTKNVEIAIINALDTIGDNKIIGSLVDALRVEITTYGHMLNLVSGLYGALGGFEIPNDSLFVLRHTENEIDKAMRSQTDQVCQAIVNTLLNFDEEGREPLVKTLQEIIRDGDKSKGVSSSFVNHEAEKLLKKI